MSDIVKREIRPIKKIRVYQIIADELIDYITSNKLLPNEPLPSEMELAELFNVSRTSIREAIIYLDSLGIVSVEGNNKLVVNDSNLQSVNRNLLFAFKKDDISFKDIIDLRIVIETGALGLCPSPIRQEYLDEFAAIIDDSRRKFSEGIPIHEEDFRFHSCLLRMAGNPIFTKFDIFLKEFFYNKPIVKEQENNKTSIDGHNAIYQCLLENRKDLAIDLLKEHLTCLYKKDFLNS